MKRIFAELARPLTTTGSAAQAAAVCYRLTGSSVEFLLVNTSSGKWTFPKGRVSPDVSPGETALQEAWEEAGARGTIEENPFGYYLDAKRGLGHESRIQEIRIAAYLFEVQSTGAPRESGRNPSWLSPAEAKKRLIEGRTAPYSYGIVGIIDAALKELKVKRQRPPRMLVPVRHALSRRAL